MREWQGSAVPQVWRDQEINGKTPLMQWIYLSPHLDDVALSCGGLLWEQSQAGEKVSVWSICAGDPPVGSVSPFAESLHERWETPADAWKQRREEDLLSCRLLGASALHFAIPDCIYRRGGENQAPLYDSEQSLWGEVHPAEAALVEELADQMARRLARCLPEPAELFYLVCPLTLGGHVDHRLTRAAAERLVQRGAIPWLWFYADYPYVLKEANLPERIAREGLGGITFPVSDPGLDAWQDSVAAHATQISTFWPDLGAMRAAICSFCEKMSGVALLHPLDD